MVDRDGGDAVFPTTPLTLGGGARTGRRHLWEGLFAWQRFDACICTHLPAPAVTM